MQKRNIIIVLYRFIVVLLIILFSSIGLNMVFTSMSGPLKFPDSFLNVNYTVLILSLIILVFSIVIVAISLKLYTSAKSIQQNNKIEFFSNISHELKTPLTVILGAIQLLDQKKSAILDDRQKPDKHLQIIKNNCYRLLRLVNYVLDISRIDSGYIKLTLTNINIVYLIEEITQSVIPYAEQKNLTLEFDTEQEEIITAVDIDKIERIVLNLLSNAIKFTPSGGKISVNIHQLEDKVIIIVMDTGPGVPENKKDIIFKRFHQAGTYLTRDHEGSGIGLSLVKSFVELHNGNISLNSGENKGSQFLIELPLKICEESKEYASNTQNQQKRIIEAINIEFSDIYSL